MATNEEFSCRFKACGLGLLSQKTARIEVKAALPKGGLAKYESKLFVNWKKNGEAVFHPSCWELLVASSKKKPPSRSRSKSSRISKKAKNVLEILKFEKVRYILQLISN